MSKYLWPVDGDTAPIATITLHVEIAVHYKFSHVTQSYEVILNYDHTYTAYRLAEIPWPDVNWSGTVFDPVTAKYYHRAGWGAEPGSQDFFVARWWPRRADIAPGRLCAPYHRNVASWPLNGLNVAPALPFYEGTLHRPVRGFASAMPGSLVIDNQFSGAPAIVQRRILDTFGSPDESYDTGDPDDIHFPDTLPAAMASATLNRITRGKFTDEFGWDLAFSNSGVIASVDGPYPMPGMTCAVAGDAGELTIADLCTFHEVALGPATHSVGIYSQSDTGVRGSVVIPGLCTIGTAEAGRNIYSVSTYSQAGTPDLAASGSMSGNELKILLPTDSAGHDAVLTGAMVLAGMYAWSGAKLVASNPGDGLTALRTWRLADGRPANVDAPVYGAMVGTELQIFLPTQSAGENSLLTGATVVANIAAWSLGLLTADDPGDGIFAAVDEEDLTGGTETLRGLADHADASLRDTFILRALTDRAAMNITTLKKSDGGAQDFGGTFTWDFPPPSSSWRNSVLGYTHTDLWNAQYKLTVAVA